MAGALRWTRNWWARSPSTTSLLQGDRSWCCQKNLAGGGVGRQLPFRDAHTLSLPGPKDEPGDHPLGGDALYLVPEFSAQFEDLLLGGDRDQPPDCAVLAEQGRPDVCCCNLSPSGGAHAAAPILALEPREI